MGNAVTPWGIQRLGDIFHSDVQAGLPDGRWVAAVASPYPTNLRERVRGAWWILTGRAVAFIWPKAGDLEAIWRRENPTLRPSAYPFIPLGECETRPTPSECRGEHQ